MTTTFKWMALGAALGFSVAMGVSCGPAKCNAQNCAFGCCDNAGTCQMGSNDTQCGTSGNACMQCTLGQSCQLGVCTIGGTGGNGGNGGGGAQGGGSGGGAQGGGSGGGAQGGGTGGGASDPLCNRISNAATSFFNGRQVCTDGSNTVNSNPNLNSQCNAALPQCSSSSDRSGLATLAGCFETAQTCTAGNESTAIQAFIGCNVGAQSNLSAGCAAALGGSPTGGGTGGGTPTGGGTGGGTPTGGGVGGGTPTGGGTGGGVPTGGGGGTTNACTTYASRYATIMNGRSTCASSGFQMNAAPNLASQCTSACSGMMDQSLINAALPCLQGVPACTSPNEQSTLFGFNSCVSDSIGGLSPACQSALTTFGPSGTGGGGGGTPVGGGTGGGTPVGGGTGGGGCAVISNFATVRGNGVYDTTNDNTIGLGANSPTDPTDILQLEIWWGGSSVALPVTSGLSSQTYATCALCAVLHRGCSGSSTNNCVGGHYLARTGSMTVSNAPRGMGGTFAGSITGSSPTFVTFEEWDLMNDDRISGGRCVIVNSGSMTVTVAP